MTRLRGSRGLLAPTMVSLAASKWPKLGLFKGRGLEGAGAFVASLSATKLDAPQGTLATLETMNRKD